MAVLLQSAWLGGLVVFLVALLVRLVYLLEVSRNPTFVTPIMDAFDYDRLARRLLEGQRDAHLFWQPVFYPLYLATTYALSSGSIVFAKTLQCVLGAVTAALSYALGRTLAAPSVGWLAGLTTALCGPLIFEEAELMPTGWAAFWSVLLVLLLTRLNAGLRRVSQDAPTAAVTPAPRASPPGESVGEATPKHAPASGSARAGHTPGFTQRGGWFAQFGAFLLLGLVAGLAYLARPEILLFLLAAAAWTAWRLSRTLGLRAAAARGLLIMAGAAAPILPLATWNYVEFGQFGVTPASGGLNLYIGNNPRAAETVALRPGRGWNELYEMPRQAGVRGGLWAESAWFYAQVRAFVQTQPGAFLRGLGEKTVQYLSARELPRSISVYTFREWSALLSALVWKVGAFGFPAGVILPLAAIGALASLPLMRRAPASESSGRRAAAAAPLWLFLAFAPLGTILVFVASRFRAPLWPLLAVAAALGVAALFGWIRQRRWGALTLAALLGAGVLAIGVAPGPFPQERTHYDAELFHFMGIRHLTDNPELARQNFAEAVRRNPGDAELHSLLGQVQLKTGRLVDALVSFVESLRLDPEAGETYANLGSTLLALGRIDEALRALEQARLRTPANPEVLYNLGVLYDQQGRLEAAADAFQQAIDVRPDNPLALYALGTVLQKLGQSEDASALYLETLRYDPNHAGARARLGVSD